MLIAEFSHKGEEIEIDDALWQHDYGQKIQIKGLDLPEVFEVHFAWKDIEKAKVVTGSTIDGVSTVDIPNVALEQRRAITAYVYLSNAVEGETVNTILMTVNKRKAPENFEIPEKIDLFHHTVEATAEYQRQAKESEERAAGLSADAEAWAHGREDHPDQAQDNAKYYAEQAAKSAAEVPGKTEQAKKDIEAARKRAVSAVTSQQETSVQAVATEGKKHTDATKKYAETVASSRQAVEETAQAVATQAQEVSQNTQTVANNTNNAAKSAESAQTSANNAAKSAEGVQGAVDQITKNTQDVASLKGDISNKITKFYASNQGETNITDSDNGKIMDMMLYGKSEQATTNGAQLLDVETAYTDSDVAEINGNKIIFASIQTSSPDLKRNYGNIEAGTYTVSAKPCLGATSVRIEIYIDGIKKADSFDSKSPMKTFNIESGNLSIKTFSTKPENSVDTVYGGVADLIMCKGDTACAWEPYTGGVPSPNPDYPQEIKAVENPEVKIYGKNLLNYTSFPDSATLSGITIKNNNDGSFTVSGVKERQGGVNLQGKKCVIPKGTYVMSGFLNELYIVISFIKNGVIQYLQKTSKPFTFDEDTEITPYIQANDDYKNETVTIYPQIEKGSTNTSYEPYKKEQTSTLPYVLNAIPVGSGNNYMDDTGQKWVSDEVDFERGVYVQRVGTYSFSGNEILKNSATYPAGGNYTEETIRYQYNQLNDASGSTQSDVVCTHFVNGKYKTNVACAYNGMVFLFVPSAKFPTANDFANFLKEQKEKSVPVKINYILKTPIETPLTQEEITTYRHFHTNYPVTNVSIASEQLDGYTVFNYPISMANGWNYVKQQLNDNRDYIYDMDLQSAEAYVNSEYAVTLTELEV